MRQSGLYPAMVSAIERVERALEGPSAPVGSRLCNRSRGFHIQFILENTGLSGANEEFDGLSIRLEGRVSPSWSLRVRRRPNERKRKAENHD